MVVPPPLRDRAPGHSVHGPAFRRQTSVIADALAHSHDLPHLELSDDSCPH